MIIDRVLKMYPLPLLIVKPSYLVGDIARLYSEKHTGIALVCDETDRLMGLISLGDVVHAVGQRGAVALELPASAIMTSALTTCTPTDEIATALDAMVKAGVHHLPVVQDGRLIGLIEKTEALQTLYEEAALDFSQLRNYVFKVGGRY